MENKEIIDQIDNCVSDFQYYSRNANKIIDYLGHKDKSLISGGLSRLKMIIVSQNTYPVARFLALHMVLKSCELRGKDILELLSESGDFLLFCRNLLDSEITKKFKNRGGSLFTRDFEVIGRNLI